MDQDIYKAMCVTFMHQVYDNLPGYGAGFDRTQAEEYLKEVRPDAILHLAAGFFGYALYDTGIAKKLPGLVGDPLKVWSDACKENGVKFGCIVRSFCSESTIHNDEWMCIKRNGQISELEHCSNRQWVDEYLLPLLLEVNRMQNPDFLWIDGAWLPYDREELCFCDTCREKYLKFCDELMPDDPDEEEWIKIRNFHRKCREDVIERIGNTLRQVNPKLRLSYNLLYFYGDFYKPGEGTDLISWDGWGVPGIHNAPFEVAYVGNLGKPFEFMIREIGWTIAKPDRGFKRFNRLKPLGQLKMETALTLAYGGRLNLWGELDDDGGIMKDRLSQHRQLSEFVREREDWCIDNKSVAEVAILASYRDHCRDVNQPVLKAARQLLQESHITYNIIREQDLPGCINKYSTVLLPEIHNLGAEAVCAVRKYVETGNTVVMIAGKVSPDSEEWIDRLFDSKVSFSPYESDKSDRRIDNWNGRYIDLERESTILSGEYKPLMLHRIDDRPLLAEVYIGEGRVLIICDLLLTDFNETHWPGTRDFVTSVMRMAISPGTMLKIEGMPGIEAVVNKKGEDLYVHLVNITPNKTFGSEAELYFESTMPYFNIPVTIRPPKTPEYISIMPENNKLEYTIGKDGEVSVIIPRLDYHVGICFKGAV